MFENDGLWPCKCRQCKKEWYASIAAIRADEVILCPYCDVRDSFHLPDFNRALAAARSGDYDFLTWNGSRHSFGREPMPRNRQQLGAEHDPEGSLDAAQN